ncbi:MAG: UDP-N-acetylmuramoyl-tripeptide--D-alanyl-D-alanine ligase, partial [Lachnospiraceae bacterium]|nr:UDP-N-acetylmuramoyl-tripeptide--D-alanyl-D-alanine ligase [Lachnospiraceae bacterium]
MIQISIQDIISVTGGKLLSGDPETRVSLFAVDSRAVKPGTLFTAVTGGNSDGHLYLKKAFENGASAALVSEACVPDVYGPDGVEETFANFPMILVPDTVEALQKAGELKRSRHHIPAVGVTGSVGKTTSREMISYALSAERNVFTTAKNYNNRIGVPLTLSEISEEHEIAVLELGMNVPGELGTISALTDLDSALITNVGVAHIEYYGTKDAIAKEKFTVTRGFSSGRTEEKMLFLNHDDPLLMKYRDMTGFPVTTFGLTEGSDYRAS